MKPIWRGTISFGLVVIYVDLFSAIKTHPLSFKLLHRDCLTPIHNKRWCNSCDKEVQLSDLVKGIKLPNGKYFIMSHEALEQLKSVKSNSIEVLACINSCKINPLYFNEHYFVLPHKQADKAFYLFNEVLESTNRSIVCKINMKEKQHICILEPFGEGMLLSTLHYGYEIKDFPQIDMQLPKITKAEFELAQKLIDSITVNKFDIKAYKEEPVEKILTKIEKMTKKIEPSIKGKKVSKEVVLLDALKASVKKIKKS